MFYDLEDPTGFMREIHEVLDDDGIWIFEQSYLPLMIERDAYTRSAMNMSATMHYIN